MQARDQDEGIPGCCPLVTLGTMDIMGDTMIGPPIPYCGVCGGAPEPENRDVCCGRNFCCRTGAEEADGGACDCPCPCSCCAMCVCYPILLPLSFLWPDVLRIGPYWCSWACGPCDDCGGGKYSRTWWYTD